MPLIIIVLAIIVIFLTARDSNINSQRKQDRYTAEIRKTNAKLEFELVEKFYNQDGCAKDDAIEKAKEELIKLGFEPCIPKSAYRLDSGSICVYGYGYDCQKLDSHAVRSLNKDFKTRADAANIKFASQEEFDKKQEEYVYNNLPKTIEEYEHYLHLSIERSKAVRVGNFLSYPGLGTCEVIALDYDRLQHTVKVISTGEIKQIPFADKRIIRL